MAVKRDYYEVLGVGRQASADDLKRAFRKIAMDSHPDRNPDDAVAAARFKEASEAYAVLSDPGRRRTYDMFGHSAVEAGGGPGIDFTDMPFADIFDTFFGGGGRSRRQRSNRGDDLRYDMTISFEEAFVGVEKQIDVPRLVACEHCSGTGAEPGSGEETCPGCRITFKMACCKLSDLVACGFVVWCSKVAVVNCLALSDSTAQCVTRTLRDPA